MASDGVGQFLYNASVHAEANSSITKVVYMKATDPNGNIITGFSDAFTI